MNIVKFEDVSFCYPDTFSKNQSISNLFSLNMKYINVLSSVSFEFKEKSKVGLIGINGSGKTTLLKLISKILNPFSGYISNYSKFVSLVSTTLPFNYELNAYDNIRILNNYYDFDMDFNDIISFSEIGNFSKYPFKYYSAGMKTKLSTSCLLSSKVKNIVIDEAIITGDKKFNNKVNNLIKKKLLNFDHLYLASHSEQLLKNYTTKCILMHEGKILLIDDTDRVIKEYDKHIQTL